VSKQFLEGHTESYEHRGITGKCQAILQSTIYADQFHVFPDTTMKTMFSLPHHMIIFQQEKMAGKDM